MGRMPVAVAMLAAALLGSGVQALALNLCVEGAYPPFSETAADGSIVGFDPDIGQALCAQMGETCTLVKVDWDGIIPALLEKKCDAIVASMSDTAERRERIAFTDRYYKASVRFVAAEGAGLADTPEAMADKVVGVQRGTVNQAYMRAHYPRTPLRLYGNQEHVLLDLALGRLDAVLGEAVQLQAGFLATPAGQGFAFFGGERYDSAIQGEGAAIGVRKEDEGLRERLNAGLAAIRADGTYDAIARRYFDFDIYGGS